MKAVICGAGIAGLSLAQRLSSIGWNVVVIEKSAGPREQGYMMDFFGLGYVTLSAPTCWSEPTRSRRDPLRSAAHGFRRRGTVPPLPRLPHRRIHLRRSPDLRLPAQPVLPHRHHRSANGPLRSARWQGCRVYDQVAQIEITQWSRERVILVGDACQAVSLLAGQGASLAIAAPTYSASSWRAQTPSTPR
ncbi:MAG: NAD(P)-binding protein [Pseudonocardiaceae bacterium]